MYGTVFRQKSFMHLWLCLEFDLSLCNMQCPGERYRCSSVFLSLKLWYRNMVLYYMNLKNIMTTVPKCQSNNNTRHLSVICHTHVFEETVKPEVRSLKFYLWSMKCELWSMKCEVWSVNCEVWIMNNEVWSMKSEVWSVNSELWSV